MSSPQTPLLKKRKLNNGSAKRPPQSQPSLSPGWSMLFNKRKTNSIKKPAASDSKSSKRKTIKTISTTHKNAIFTVLKKTYNALIPTLTSNKSTQKYISLNLNLKEEADDIDNNQGTLLPIIEHDIEELKKASFGQKILKDEDVLLTTLDWMIERHERKEMKDELCNDDYKENTHLTVKYVRHKVEEEHNGCIAWSEPEGGKLWCTECRDWCINDPDILMLLAPRGDSLVTGGMSRFRPDRVWNHLHGALHAAVQKAKADGNNTNTIPSMIVAVNINKEELATYIVTLVYMDRKRPPLCGNSYPARRLLDGIVEHWLALDPDQTKDFQPQLHHIDHNNPSYYRDVLEMIAKDVNDKYVDDAKQMDVVNVNVNKKQVDDVNVNKKQADDVNVNKKQTDDESYSSSSDSDDDKPIVDYRKIISSRSDSDTDSDLSSNESD